MQTAVDKLPDCGEKTKLMQYLCMYDTLVKMDSSQVMYCSVSDTFQEAEKIWQIRVGASNDAKVVGEILHYCLLLDGSEFKEGVGPRTALEIKLQVAIDKHDKARADTK